MTRSIILHTSISPPYSRKRYAYVAIMQILHGLPRHLIGFLGYRAMPEIRAFWSVCNKRKYLLIGGIGYGSEREHVALLKTNNN
jgi:hypothetical protein